MTILRSGASQKYSTNWANAFGENKSFKTKSSSPKGDSKRSAAGKASTLKAAQVKPDKTKTEKSKTKSKAKQESSPVTKPKNKKTGKSVRGKSKTA